MPYITIQSIAEAVRSLKEGLTEDGKKSPILCRWWDELHSTAGKEEKRKRFKKNACSRFGFAV
jgi:hypothetical protein